MTEQTSAALPKSGANAFFVMLLTLLAMGGGLVFAFVNEAISFALEAATPYVEQGFEVREDNWSGEVESGKPLLVRHQLFRGNEYWFWAGTSIPGASVEVAVFDKKGMAVGLETFSKEGKAGVRVLPGKTGTYYIRVIVTRKKTTETANAGGGEEAPSDSLDWGLVYGYR